MLRGHSEKKKKKIVMNQLEERFWVNFEFIENTSEVLFNQTLSHVFIITLDNIKIFLIWEKIEETCDASPVPIRADW